MTFRLLKWLWSFISKERALLGLAICCALLASACIALGPRLIGLIVDNALTAKSTQILLITCGTYAACEVIRLIATSAHSYIFQALGQRIIFDIRTSLFAHVLSLRIATLDHKLTGDINSRLTHDLDALSALCNAGFVRILEKLLFVSVMSISIYALSPQIGVLVLCAFGFFALFGILYSFKLASIFKQLRAKIGELNAFLSERITALPQIRFLCREERESLQGIELSNDLRLLKHKPALFFGTLHASFTLVAGISVASLLYFSPGLVHSNAISVGTLVALISSLGLLFWPILIILYDWHIFVSGIAAASRIREVFDWECEPLEAQLHSWSAQGKIEFKSVWFAYTEENWVLEDVSFCIHPGRSVALVGPTGSGKSSILSLLLRFYEPQKGQILLDDIPIQEIPIFEIRKRLGFIPQDVQLFLAASKKTSLFGERSSPRLFSLNKS
jgi:ATP-binding cassette subfamily B protein